MKDGLQLNLNKEVLFIRCHENNNYLILSFIRSFTQYR